MKTDVIKNKKGASAILLTVVMLAAIVFVAIVVSDLVQNGIVSARTQTNSTKAFFAAEAGIEKVLNDIWKPVPFIIPNCAGSNPNRGYICFSAPVNGSISNNPNNICSSNCTASFNYYDYQILPNGTRYYVSYRLEPGSPATTTLTSLGIFGDVNRVIESRYLR